MDNETLHPIVQRAIRDTAYDQLREFVDNLEDLPGHIGQAALEIYAMAHADFGVVDFDTLQTAAVRMGYDLETEEHRGLVEAAEWFSWYVDGI